MLQNLICGEPLPIRPIENLAKRKPTGGRRTPHRGRRDYEIKRYPTETTLGDDEVVKRRVRGGNIKLSLKRASYANVIDPSTKKVKKIKILKVVKNLANRDYDRRGVITKGAIIETELGMARVRSRLGQDGVVNAILTK
ncbi:MAG: 30S ribosomal protein S8e [Candidatus Methylarchaceae archaeon HK01M]|nr:30S ribosomal protein S8e [Candidatus Methylarchaceae archaeon HK01M]